MAANIFFFFVLFFLLGIFFKFYFAFWYIFSLLSLIFWRRLSLVVILIFSFLLGGSYLSFFKFIKNQKQSEEIYILHEFSSTNYYHKYLGEFKGEKYFIYLPYFYQKLYPQDRIKAEIEILNKRIFIKNLLTVENSFYRPIYEFKELINNLIDKNYSLNSSEIIGGILYGREINDKELKEAFKNSGLSHLTAMSGYNLVIISSLVNHLFSFLSFNFLTRNFLSIFFIILFIVFTGFQASVIRAGIMIIILLIAKLIGKPTLTRNILIFTALLISLFDPLALIEDLGFQLSFLATIGLVYFEENFRKLLKFKFLSEIISAQILVLPFLWYKFGELNIFSFLNNFLITPLIPYLMIVGFLALIFFFLYPFNQFLNLPFEFLGKFIIYLGKLPTIYLPMPLFFIFIIYLLIFYFLFKFNRNEKIDFNFAFT